VNFAGLDLVEISNFQAVRLFAFDEELHLACRHVAEFHAVVAVPAD
jgi:hypothetical protein